MARINPRVTPVQPQAQPVAPVQQQGTQPAAATPAPDAPAEEKKNGKGKGRKANPKHPIVASGQLLQAIPDDYNPKKHAPLKEEDFEETAKHALWRYQGNRLEERAKALFRKADAFERTGAYSNKKTATKIVELNMQLQEAVNDMIAKGEDPGPLLAIVQQVAPQEPAAA